MIYDWEKNTMSHPIDPRSLRDCCGSFATGVTVITTRTEEGDHGMTANAFMSVSLDPPLVSISLDRGTKMLDKIRASGAYAVSILAQDMHPHAMHFAGRPDASLEDLLEERGGMPVLRGAAAHIVAEVAQEVEAGDHILFIGLVVDLDRNAQAQPLLFHSGKFGRLAEA